MSELSPRLDLPYISAAQAQKHVTHNEALRLLDGLAQLTLKGFGATTPPATPADGDMYALGPAPTGAWAANPGSLALWSDNAWLFIQPKEGWLAWGEAEAELRAYSSGNWEEVVPTLQNLESLGINTTADPINRLALASEASLFSHDGNGHQLKINKAATTDTASLLYQSNWTGHAEMGLTGDNDFHIKVSSDGTAWKNALEVRASDGTVRGDAVQANNLDTTTGRLLRMTTDRGPFDLGSKRPTILSGSLNDVQNGGVNRFLCWNTGATDVPWNYGVGMQFMAFDTTGNQLAFRRGGAPAMAFRATVTSAPTFSEWFEVFHTGNAVGTVSATPGIGSSIMERGSNANGEYVRLIDGTQICTHSVTIADVNTADGAGFRNTTGVTWTFPANFIGGTLPSLSGSVNDAGHVWPTFYCNSASMATIHAKSFTAHAGAVTAHVTAIGRWF